MLHHSRWQVSGEPSALSFAGRSSSRMKVDCVSEVSPIVLARVMLRKTSGISG